MFKPLSVRAFFELCHLLFLFRADSVVQKRADFNSGFQRKSFLKKHRADSPFLLFHLRTFCSICLWLLFLGQISLFSFSFPLVYRPSSQFFCTFFSVQKHGWHVRVLKELTPLNLKIDGYNRCLTFLLHNLSPYPSSVLFRISPNHVGILFALLL